VLLTTVEGGALRLDLTDLWMTASWRSDAGLLKTGTDHHVVAIVDGGPRVISFVIDGVLCDGGEGRPVGWGRFSPYLCDVNGADTWRVAPELHGHMGLLRVYGRYLRVSEAAANCHALRG
jgi:hypothetical protein